jgi:hypothetical protein
MILKSFPCRDTGNSSRSWPPPLADARPARHAVGFDHDHPPPLPPAREEGKQHGPARSAPRLCLTYRDFEYLFVRGTDDRIHLNRVGADFPPG